MKDDDLLKCPLLQGLSAMHRAELIGLINDSSLRARLKECLAGHVKAKGEEDCACSETKATETFEATARSWKPDAPLWRRSAKE